MADDTLRATWHDYELTCSRFRKQMETCLRNIVRNFDENGTVDWDNCGDNYGAISSLIGPDGTMLAMSLLIIDAADSEGYPTKQGEKGNFLLTMIESDGLIIVSYAPENYTDQCWVRYDDVDEWDSRMSTLEALDCTTTIAEWILQHTPKQ